MNIAICEDNLQDALLLRTHLESYLKVNNCYSEINLFFSAEEFLSVYTPGLFNLILIDIYLPGQSGMDLARTLRVADPDCLIIFITASPDFAMDGFLVRASGYLVKPVNLHKLEQTLYLCREIFARNARIIEVPQNGGVIMLSLAKISHVEIYGNKAHFHMQESVVETRLTLDEIEERMDDSAFLRCHRSCLINMNYVVGLGEQDFLMSDGTLVPIRKNGRKEIRLIYTRFKAVNGMGVVKV